MEQNQLDDLTTRMTRIETIVQEIQETVNAISVAKQNTYTEMIKLLAVFLTGGGFVEILKAVMG